MDLEHLALYVRMLDLAEARGRALVDARDRGDDYADEEDAGARQVRARQHITQRAVRVINRLNEAMENVEPNMSVDNAREAYHASIAVGIAVAHGRRFNVSSLVELVNVLEVYNSEARPLVVDTLGRAASR